MEADNRRKQQILEILDNKNLWKFNVVVSEATASATTQLAQFSMISALAKQGVPIPADELVAMTPGLAVGK